MTANIKICSGCKRELFVTREFFSPYNLSKDKLQSKCKKCRNKKWKEWNKINKENRKQYTKNWRKTNKQHIRQYEEKNKEKRRLQHRINYENRRKEISRYRTAYNKKRMRKDTNFKIATNIRIRLAHALKGNFKSGSAVRDLGCSIEDFKKYIESKWQPGMTWDNYGIRGWHLDHIMPLLGKGIHLTDEKTFLKLVHYTNYQPLWAKENLDKSNKI